MFKMKDIREKIKAFAIFFCLKIPWKKEEKKKLETKS